MIHPTIVIEQPQETAVQEPIQNSDVTQHQPETGADWTSWLILGLAAFAIYTYAIQG